MPVTKTAKRALRASDRKAYINKIITYNLESAIRIAKKSGKQADVSRVFSMADRAVKKDLIHKNKASRIKSRLSNFVEKTFGKKAIAAKPVKSKKTTVKPTKKTVKKTSKK